MIVVVFLFFLNVDRSHFHIKQVLLTYLQKNTQQIQFLFEHILLPLLLLSFCLKLRCFLAESVFLLTTDKLR